nr:NlpC/P60 family protein [uncultured Pseudomonas sp.]
MIPDDIIASARKLIGTKFLHQGRVPGLGLDCAGTLAAVLDDLGLPYIDEQGYPRTPYDGQLERNLDEQPSLRRIPAGEAAAGDVLVMRMKSAPQHIAIHAGSIRGQTYIIHGSEEHGKVAHHRLDDLWRARVVRAYRVERPA